MTEAFALQCGPQRARAVLGGQSPEVGVQGL
jgi:hypothetical protein